jgi:hypothetical protein
MAAVVQVLPVAARGSGSDPTRVDAGDGGQAQGLIDARAAAHAATPTTGLALVLLVLLGSTTALLVRRRRPVLPLRVRTGRVGGQPPPRP